MKKNLYVRPRVKAGRVWCPRCRQWLEPAAFSQNNSRKVGYEAYCRACRVGEDTEYQHRYYLAHRELKP